MIQEIPEICFFFFSLRENGKVCERFKTMKVDFAVMAPFLIDFATSPYRKTYIAMNFLIIYLALQMAFLFAAQFRRHRRNQSLTLARVYLAYMSFFMGTTVILVFIAIKRYWMVDIPGAQQIIYITMSTMMFLFIAIIESHYNRSGQFRTRYFFSIYSLLLTSMFVLIPPENGLIIIPIIGSVVPLIAPVAFVVYLYRNTTGTLKKRISFQLIALLMLYLGIAFSMETTVERFQSEALLIVGMLLMIISLNAIYLSFYQVDIIAESGWQEHLEQLFIIRKLTHKLLYRLDLSKLMDGTGEGESDHSELISGGLIGIDSLTKTISESKADKTGLKLIEQDNKYIYLEHGVDVIACFIATEKLNSLRYYLRQIRNAFETYYVTQTIDWENIQSSNFNPMDEKVREILGIREEGD